MAASSCPEFSFRYNSTLCACLPGRYLDGAARRCVPMEDGEWRAGATSSSSSSAGAGGATPPPLLGEVLPLGSVERVVSSEAVAVKVTLLLLVLWLAFCAAVRFGPVGGGRTAWFRLRWWVARMDTRFSTKHQLEDLKEVRKRKTELGGTFSVASWILFLGLVSALLYQVITRRSIEVHRVKPTNAPDLLAFVNDMEFNITTISSMSCAHLRGLNQLMVGMPGSIYHRVYPLSTYTNYTCHNTSRGPIVSLKCTGCKVPTGDHYISWHFVDLPNDPATAVGFEFNLTAKAHHDNKHMSYVSGTLTGGSFSDDGPQTFRGQDMNVLRIRLFPQKFTFLDNLRLIQPLLHDFIPGSYFSEIGDLRASLQNSKDGLVNTTLYISYPSDYIVEIDKYKVVGIVSFFAQVGGLYTISLAVFLYLLLQCEARFRKLRFEDGTMRDIRSQRRAQRHWDTVRKYVKFTWGHSNMDLKSISSRRHDGVRPVRCCGVGSLHKVKHPSQRSSIYNAKMADISCQTDFGPDVSYSGFVKSSSADSTIDFEEISHHSESKHEIDDIKEEGRRTEVTSISYSSSCS